MFGLPSGLAQEIFRDVGRELKERREHDDLYSIYSYAAPDLPPDPATKDPDLAARLNDNAELAQDKLSKVRGEIGVGCSMDGLGWKQSLIKSSFIFFFMLEILH